MQRQIVGFAVVLLTVFIPAAAQVDGSGTSHYIPVWTDSNSLGNSILFQSNGMVGVGTTAPTATLNVAGQNASLPNSNAPAVLKAIGGIGGTGDRPGSGGPIQLVGGQGARSCICNAPGGAGGSAWFSGGAGGHGFVNGGIGGWLQIASGTGGGITPSGATGGLGALIVLAPGRGATWGEGVSHGGSGGSITLQPGAGGVGTASSGTTGNVVLVPRGGNVGIGTTGPNNTLEVAVYGTTLADSWTTRSSRRFKTNIEPLLGALEKVTRLQGVSYDRKADGKHEIGVVAEDVEQIIPEIVSRDPETHEVQGVDYARVSALLIEAIKSQQAEIQQLRARIERFEAQTSVQSWADQ